MTRLPLRRREGVPGADPDVATASAVAAAAAQDVAQQARADAVLGAPPAPLRLVFVMSTVTGYFRFVEPPIRLLLERGHHVHVVFERHRAEEARWLESIHEEHPRFTWSRAGFLKLDPWYEFAHDVVAARDYVHVLRPRFANAPSLIGRARKRAPKPIHKILWFPPARSAPVLAAFDFLLRTVEEALPPAAGLSRFVAEQRPDVLLLAPHLMPGARSDQYIEAADQLGVPSAICVASWDNLSSKQLIRRIPDVVLVWNETQRREAVQLHDIPADKVVVTGAQCYDHWFSWTASPREDFCRRAGLDPDRPYVLYVAGALFPAEITESEFVLRWIERLRSSADPALREAGVLVRPHPNRTAEWHDVDLAALPHVSLFPGGPGRMPIARDARQDYYDSLYHSAAVFGVNTSAMIEAGIVGRPVHTLMVPEFSGSQDGTLHFQYLTEAGGGLLRVAHSFEEHLAQLGEAVRRDGDGFGRTEFLEAFVRPYGLGVPATPLFVAAVERLGQRKRKVPRRDRRLWLRPLRTALLRYLRARRWDREHAFARERAEVD
ncbi:MAG TPA: hypothetical protein VN213_19045, partial [Solirubrobacteraceae bacterium]|nr:hypothetical protein [Solirubrobacteraceae bacterium]